MATTLKVKMSDAALKQQREAQVQRVIDVFGETLPDCRLLCFFDDEDCQEFKCIMGQRNRGFHRVISDRTPFAGWPAYLTDCIFVDDGVSLYYPRVFDHVIYLHGSTCTNEVGMTMTFAHELQHVIQRVNDPELVAVNNIVRLLPRRIIDELGLEWSDIPTEREARATGKRIAVILHGQEAVQRFISERLATEIDAVEIADLQFIQQLEPSNPYNLKAGTASLFSRLKAYRRELDETIEHLKTDPEFELVDLDVWMEAGETY